MFHELSEPPPAEDTAECLPAGYYDVSAPSQHDPRWRFAVIANTIFDDFTTMTKDQRDVIANLENFVSPDTQRAFDEMSVAWKMGMILHGLPGTGKTIALKQAIDFLVGKGCIVLRDPPASLMGTIVRKARGGKRPLPISDIILRNARFKAHRQPVIACVYDECEYPLHMHESSFLSLLDGMTSSHGVIYLFATNKMCEIPKRIYARPSRIAYVKEFGLPENEVVRAYVSGLLKNYSGRSEKMVDEICDAVEWVGGLVIDEVKSVVISTVTMKLDPKESAKRCLDNRNSSYGTDDSEY